MVLADGGGSGDDKLVTQCIEKGSWLAASCEVWHISGKWSPWSLTLRESADNSCADSSLKQIGREQRVDDRVRDGTDRSLV